MLRGKLEAWVLDNPRAVLWLILGLAIPYWLLCLGIALAVVAGGGRCGG